MALFQSLNFIWSNHIQVYREVSLTLYKSANGEYSGVPWRKYSYGTL